MAMNLKPLNIRTLKDGKMLEQFDREFSELRKQLIRFAKENKEKALGAKAALTLTIAFKIANVEDASYLVTYGISKKAPQHPTESILAIQAEHNGEPMLFGTAQPVPVPATETDGADAESEADRKTRAGGL